MLAVVTFAIGIVFGALGVLVCSRNTILQGARTLMSQAADDLVAKITALPAEFDAKYSGQIADLQAQLDAQKAEHEADLVKLSDAVTAIAPAA